MSDGEEWTEAVKECCRNWNACYGEPPCFELDGITTPCADCLAGRENPDWENGDEA